MIKMTFCIITHVLHKECERKYYAYGPYVREMNLWIKNVDNVIIVAPIDYTIKPDLIDIPYNHNQITFLRIPRFDVLSFKSILKTIYLLPKIIIQIYKGMLKADHIHLRCPGNVGLIGCFLQILFPSKKKTAKYASNWDWNIKQPWSYRLQQRILRNTFLTRNMTALVYGDWPDRTKNIKPFFTASYSEKERLSVKKAPLSDGLKLAFIGTLTENKSPLTSLEVLKSLSEKGVMSTLTLCGDGPQRAILEQKISEYGVGSIVKILGNVGAERVKEVLKASHFLVFISRSEAWGKATSEAMWWGCVPITTPVSCVPWMLGNGSRGELITGVVNEIVHLLEAYISDPSKFDEKSIKAMEWARQYTLEKFEKEIKNLI